MPGIDYHQLRRQVSMREVLNLIGFRPTWRRGPQLRGPCPIPGCCSSSPRPFSVHLARQAYHCFACGSQGNALDLWAAARRLSLHQAAVALCQAASLIPPRLPNRRQSCRVASRAPSRNHCPGALPPRKWLPF
jgi:DNA primase